MEHEGVEIERSFLLKGLPSIPAEAQTLRLEQGYLPSQAESIEGRLRRTTKPDGTVVLTHTIKKGMGLVRSEQERTLSPEEFERHWPKTAGRRLRKTRHLLWVDGLPWAIDDFDGPDLVLAEVELPAADTPFEIPAWLAPHIERDVTDEPEYRNYALAVRAGLLDAGKGNDNG